MEVKESWVRKRVSNKISVIGSGGWGTALAALLKNNGHEVCLWSWCDSERENIEKNGENKEFLPGVTLPKGIIYTSEIEFATRFANFLVMAVPSHGVKDTAGQISRYIGQGVPIVNVAKGFEPEGFSLLSRVIKEQCPKNPVCVLSGPSHAEEVARGLPTTVVAASADMAVAKLTQDMFMAPTFRVYTSDDVTGIEIGGALKNIIALCAGICDGLGLGDNTKAALMTRGIVEIQRLGRKMGANDKTFNGLTGVGDLIVTCTSMHSRNRRAGILIGQGNTVTDTVNKVHMVVEGISAAKAAYLLSKKHGIEMPIIEAAYNVLFKGVPPKDAVAQLMVRDKKSEEETVS